MYPDLWFQEDKESQSDAKCNLKQKNPNKKKEKVNHMKHLKSAMRFHKDNGHCDDITGKYHGANPDKVVNAHILGSDVLMITIGDTMQDAVSFSEMRPFQRLVGL